jgi:hypothetical protein
VTEASIRAPTEEFEETTVAPNAGPAVRRHTRRLEDKLLVAFHHACDVSDLEVAGHVLRVLELMLARRPVQPDANRRRNMESLVAAHERMWHIRHREN